MHCLGCACRTRCQLGLHLRSGVNKYNLDNMPFGTSACDVYEPMISMHAPSGTLHVDIHKKPGANPDLTQDPLIEHPASSSVTRCASESMNAPYR